MKHPRTLYAIGDIHGSYKLLSPLLHYIGLELEKTPTSECKVIFLGDYIARGKESKAVIESLIDFKKQFKGKCVFLRGNHEEELFNFLNDPFKYQDWLKFGGVELIESYNVEVGSTKELITLAHKLMLAIPATHLEFIKSLDNFHEEARYFFVHAGINPEKEINNQEIKDLLWIREKFLNSQKNFGKVVVHGHTVENKEGKINLRKNRIGIDTCAHETGVLSCLVIREEILYVLQTPSLKLEKLEYNKSY